MTGSIGLAKEFLNHYRYCFDFFFSLRTLAADFKYALAWGRSTKFSPQRVGLTHQMEDEDVIMIVKK